MNCRNCGNSIPEQSKFCIHCGSKIEESHNLDNLNNTKIDSSSKIMMDEFEANKLKIHACKKCGKIICSNSDICNTCPKTNKKRKNIFYVAAITVVLLLAFFGYQSSIHSAAMDALEKKSYETAYNHLISLKKMGMASREDIEIIKTLEYAEEENYFDAFSTIVFVENSKTDNLFYHLEQKVYSQGVRLYYDDNFSEARDYFSIISYYKDSEGYLALIEAKTSGNNYSTVRQLMHFQDANTVLLDIYSTEFLEGRWINGNKYFEMKDDGHTWYNLPFIDVDGYYNFIDGTYTVEGTKIFDFEIIDYNTISVFCFKDGSIYTLHRR